ncbi:MAG: CoA-binding protein [Ignavibacteriales bacterium]|nr:CoA-binding protein [Ignavibacteriales bacterium]
MPFDDDATLRKILKEAKTIAVVGASEKPWRDSKNIAEFLIREGYDVIPVNPKYETVLGRTCYPDLQSVPQRVDIVDVFRNPEHLDEIVKGAIETKAKTMWLQLGVVNEEAAWKAEEAGIQVVMDRCILVDHRRLM